jgi:uncharacterized damage-inducible protein DinB
MKQPEVWQRGPVAGVPPLLQPVAHAILQANEEIKALAVGLPPALVWQQPAGMASPAFHIQHITGVLERLFTYAKGEPLTNEQLLSLSQEGKTNENIGIEYLLKRLDDQITESIVQLRETDENKLLEVRGIGRKQIPTTVLGLLFHAAEHTMRHTGQLLVTVKVLLANNG